MTATFSHRLAPLNLIVKELTGDMQLSKSELEETQVLFSPLQCMVNLVRDALDSTNDLLSDIFR